MLMYINFSRCIQLTFDIQISKRICLMRRMSFVSFFSSEKILRGLGSIPNKLARLTREWLAKPVLAKPLNDLINFALSYKVKCKKGVIFRRNRGGNNERTKHICG